MRSDINPAITIRIDRTDANTGRSIKVRAIIQSPPPEPGYPAVTSTSLPQLRGRRCLGLPQSAVGCLPARLRLLRAHAQCLGCRQCKPPSADPTAQLRAAAPKWHWEAKYAAVLPAQIGRGASPFGGS